MCFTINPALKPKSSTKVPFAGETIELKVKDNKFPKRENIASAFLNEELFIMRSTGEVELFSWGFIQALKNDDAETREIKFMTANAKAETIFEKQLYKNAIMNSHCLILANGFFEWRHVNNKKYPHFIYLNDKEPFWIGGIYNSWLNTDTGEIKNTVSMVTTAANPMMEVIHNKKKRMPLIFERNKEEIWLETNLSKEEIEKQMVPLDEKHMGYHTISKRITSKTENVDDPRILAPYEYPELGESQLSLF